MSQSEIFDMLLEEAEQMHMKRKEATEMLKVLNKHHCLKAVFWMTTL